MDCVWMWTPGTSVREFRGPGGWRPRCSLGRISRTRPRGSLESVMMEWTVVQQLITLSDAGKAVSDRRAVETCV